MQGERALVERATGNRPFDNACAECRKRADVIERGNAARCHHGEAGDLGDMPIRLRVDARLHAVAGDIGEYQVLEAQARELAHHVVGAARNALAPAVHAHLAVARRDVGDEQVAECACSHLGEARLAHEHGAERDATAPQPRKLVDAREALGNPYKILIDGAVSPEVIVRAAAMGVDGFSMGTQCLFGQPGTYAEIFQRIRASLGDE